MPRRTVQVHGVERLVARMTKFANAARQETRNIINVGYAAPYAKYVHEKIEMKLAGQPRKSGIGFYWGRPIRPGGQAKFLEQPAREMRDLIGAKVAEVTKTTKSLKRGLYSGGVLLRNASQKLVPIEYGTLIASAFVEIEQR